MARPTRTESSLAHPRYVMRPSVSIALARGLRPHWLALTLALPVAGTSKSSGADARACAIDPRRVVCLVCVAVPYFAPEPQYERSSSCHCHCRPELSKIDASATLRVNLAQRHLRLTSTALLLIAQPCRDYWHPCFLASRDPAHWLEHSVA